MPPSEPAPIHDRPAPWRGLLELLLPARCATCRAAVVDSAALCPQCSASLPWLPRDGCTLCQARLQATGPTPADPPRARCATCARRATPLDACWAAVAFDGEAERWIHRFKYPGRGLRGLEPAPRAVVEQWVRESCRWVPGPTPDLVVPVPLHPLRLRERGFNPAALLAREIARSRGVPVAPRALRRVRDTPSQTGLGRRARRQNVVGAFEVRPRRELPPRVWLVDDVVTTGSTLEEAARTLRLRGVTEVIGVCAARTP